jgi:hypothetical protein|tara:strand:- start:371 stop:487 length:117 start_codon:yes stop_codon:yes gene_type:complete
MNSKWQNLIYAALESLIFTCMGAITLLFIYAIAKELFA